MGISFVENYKNLSDDEIASLINNGRYELMQVIIERYYPVVLFNVRKYCPESYREDAVQEATIALYTAVKKFDSSKSSFYTFASLCVRRSVLSVVKNRQRKKNIPDELVESLNGLEIVDSNSPEKIFFDKEDLRSLTDNIKLELSALEYKVLQLFLNGESYSNIAKSLNITDKAVDNSLSRIRKKLKCK